MGPQPGGGGAFIGKLGNSSPAPDFFAGPSPATGPALGATHGVGACAPGPLRLAERTGAMAELGGGGAEVAAPQAPWRAVVERAECDVEDLTLRTREELLLPVVTAEEEAPANGG